MSYSENRSDDEEVQTPYIVKSPNVCFGKARIRGTRMAVVFIVSEYVHRRMSPEEIREWHPDLTLAQIHAALCYYYDNRLEIDRWLLQGTELSREMERQREEEKARLS